MTNHRLPLPSLRAWPLAAALALAPPAGAQGLKPSDALQVPGFSAPPRAAAVAPVQRQADFIVAVVNSEPITNSEVRTRLIRTEQQIALRGGQMPPRRELVPLVLERMINDRAQLQMARELGVRADDNAVEGAIQTIASQNQISVAELQRRLRADGIAYSQFQSNVREELLVSRLRQREVESRVTVTEQEIDQFMREQESRTDLASLGLNLAQILVAVPENAAPEQLAALEAKARQILERARSGADFAALVSEFSATPGATSGGPMGLRGADRYPPLFVEAVQPLPVGGVAGPVRSGAGWHILKVIEKTRAGVPASTVTQTRARHILLRLTPQLSEAAAVARLAQLKQRIGAGQADFAALAREFSEDGSAKEGGDLGWANPGLFVPEFEAALAALAPNQVSDPVVSRFGVHLIQMMERRQMPLAERDRREIARNMLRERKQEEAYLLWAQEIRGRAYVEYREPPQ